ncbi:hypothetical protein B0H15DRAFT_993923 [Mycena belliarum]|uniref:HAT C-terminal dimerisation domain-containing protein n=1 Tax=Mycena belliarum TaxID=1033014 RepID=A0AAD6TMM7_9AGAR|nr:hypothetical protein B0H15DRAFT_958731 [Mycena belliae]KAJ7082178.1 hypothetical protein B0H15DRAFT_993923 [Mycena belliae]
MHQGDEEYKKGMASLEIVFVRYNEAAQAEARVESAPAAPAAVVAPALHHYGSSFLLDTVASVKAAERAEAQPRDELTGSLSSPLEQTDTVLHYWGHNTSFPILRRIARDYLAIQAAQFTFEALQLLKSAYRNGHISAGSIVARHIDALIAELDADFGSAAEDEAQDSDFEA